MVAAEVGALSLGKIGTVNDQFANFQNPDIVLFGEANFAGARIHGRFYCWRVLFLGESNFVEIQVDGAADVVLSRFGISKRGKEAEILSSLKPWKKDKWLSLLRETSREAAEVHFDRSEFRGRAGFLSIFHRPAYFHGIRCQSSTRFLDGCVFYEPAEFYFASFVDEANFGGAEFKSKLSLSNAQFLRALKFDLLRPPRRTKFGDKGRIEMLECKYESLQGLPEWKSKTSSELKLDDLTCFLEHVEGGRSTFILLEQYYRRVGNREFADFVRRYWRGREGNHKRGIARIWDRLLRRATGYGTRFVPLVMTLVILAVLDISIQITSAILELRNPNKLTIATAAFRIAHLVSVALLTAGAAVLGDTFRRSLWPDKS